MPQYGWNDCPEPVRTQIDRFVNALRDTLADNLVGIYLHGSLAMNCFNPERSDLDLLVITKGGMELDVKRRIAQLLLNTSRNPTPIEISFLTWDQLHPWQYPTPFDYHYSEDWREDVTRELVDGGWRTWNDKVYRDPDLAGHITITHHRGVCLAGKPIEAVFPSVPLEDYVDSIWRDVKAAPVAIADNPVYGVLNLCRVLRYVREGAICSKDEGGAWAVAALPSEFRAVIAHALDLYRGYCRNEAFDADELVRFATFAPAEIRSHMRMGDCCCTN